MTNAHPYDFFVSYRHREPDKSWVRKTLAVASASAALCLASGCSMGVLRGPGEEHRTPGDVAYTSFVCADEEPASPFASEMPLMVPGYAMGNLCGTQTAWAEFELTEPRNLRFLLSGSTSSVFMSLIGPDGDEAASLDPDTLEVDVAAAPGRWTIAVTAGDPAHGWDWFELQIVDLDTL